MEGWCSYGVPGVLEGRKIANGDVRRYFNEKEHCIKKGQLSFFFYSRYSAWNRLLKRTTAIPEIIVVRRLKKSPDF